MDPAKDEDELPRQAVDNEVLELLPRFFQTLEHDVDVLTAALSSGDLGLVGQLCHGLKGAGASFGFPEITRLGAKAEAAARARDDVAIRKWVAALLSYIKRVLDEGRRVPPERR